MAFFGGFSIGDPFSSHGEEEVNVEQEEEVHVEKHQHHHCSSTEESGDECCSEEEVEKQVFEPLLNPEDLPEDSPPPYFTPSAPKLFEKKVGTKIDVSKLPKIDVLFDEKKNIRKVELPKVGKEITQYKDLGKIINGSKVTVTDSVVSNIGIEEKALPLNNFDDLTGDQRKDIIQKYLDNRKIESKYDTKKKMEEFGFKETNINSKFEDIKPISNAFPQKKSEVNKIANKFCKDKFDDLSRRDKTRFIQQMKELHEKYISFHEPNPSEFNLIKEPKTYVILKHSCDYTKDRVALKMFNENSHFLDL